MSSLGRFKIYFYKTELAGRKSFRNRKKAIEATWCALEAHKRSINARFGKAEWVVVI